MVLLLCCDTVPRFIQQGPSPGKVLKIGFIVLNVFVFLCRLSHCTHHHSAQVLSRFLLYCRHCTSSLCSKGIFSKARKGRNPFIK